MVENIERQKLIETARLASALYFGPIRRVMIKEARNKVRDRKERESR